LFDENPCSKCGSTGFCKHKQLSGSHSGIGQKNQKDDKLIARDVKHNKQRSQAQERNIAEGYKAAGFAKSHRVPMSGALHEAVLFADVDPGEKFLIEAKQTRSGKLVLETGWLKKIKLEAAAVGRKPLLHAAVALDEGNYERWVAMPEEDWFNIVKENKDLDEENSFLRSELEGDI